jgi:hypothetical protein
MRQCESLTNFIWSDITLASEEPKMRFFDFKYYPDDPIDKLPQPVIKVILSAIGIVAIFAAHMIIWGTILSQ